MSLLVNPAQTLVNRDDRPIKILTFSTLFPNPGQPVHGIFVENRLRHLLKSGEAVCRVIAPIPWFPSANPRFGSYAKYVAAPAFEERDNVAVWHPRYPVIPKLGMNMAAALLYAGIHRLAKRLAAAEDFDIIDAHYFYPDGVAAALLGRALGKPVVITARGSDLNLLPNYPIPRAQIRWAAQRAAGIVTVCEALIPPLLAMGIPSGKIRALRNGVDLACFQPRDRKAARLTLGVQGPTLLSVGLLIERKGHHLIIEALSRLPGFTLLIAGGGPDRRALEALAHRIGVADRVRFLGEVPHGRLAEIYSAADALVLASSREGWPNVLLEAMACGTPVVATRVWGSGEVVADAAAGVLADTVTADAIGTGISRLFAALPDRAATRAYAERFSWEATTQGQLELFRSILAQPTA